MVKVCSCLRGKSMSPGEYGRNKKYTKLMLISRNCWWRDSGTAVVVVPYN